MLVSLKITLFGWEKKFVSGRGQILLTGSVHPITHRVKERPTERERWLC